MNDPCCRCSKPSMHKIYESGQSIHLCCACFVADGYPDGYPPADWHPECMRAAAKPVPAPQPGVVPRGWPAPVHAALSFMNHYNGLACMPLGRLPMG